MFKHAARKKMWQPKHLSLHQWVNLNKTMSNEKIGLMHQNKKHGKKEKNEKENHPPHIKNYLKDKAKSHKKVRGLILDRKPFFIQFLKIFFSINCNRIIWNKLFCTQYIYNVLTSKVVRSQITILSFSATAQFYFFLPEHVACSILLYSGNLSQLTWQNQEEQKQQLVASTHEVDQWRSVENAWCYNVPAYWNGKQDFPRTDQLVSTPTFWF